MLPSSSLRKKSNPKSQKKKWRENHPSFPTPAPRRRWSGRKGGTITSKRGQKYSSPISTPKMKKTNVRRQRGNCARFEKSTDFEGLDHRDPHQPITKIQTKKGFREKLPAKGTQLR